MPWHWEEQIPIRVERLEWALQLLQNQRNMYTSEFRAAQPDIQLTGGDMIHIMNEWMNNPQNSMKPDSLIALNQITRSKHHDFVKSRFGAMRFSIIGNEALVDHLIRFNLCGDVQPAAIHNFCEPWAAYTITYQYKEAKSASEKQEPGHIRRAKHL